MGWGHGDGDDGDGGDDDGDDNNDNLEGGAWLRGGTRSRCALTAEEASAQLI